MKANNTILPAKALADLAHNQHEVIKVYSHPFIYWNGETTTEYVFIVRVKDGRLMLLSCTDIVTIPSTVCSPDDRRVYFPAEELDKLVKRAEMLTKDDNTPDNTTPETTETMNTENTPATMNEVNELSNAGYCLDVYLNNDSEIYERYTVPAIARVVRAYKAGECVSDNPEQLAKDIQEITPAINAAVKLVKKYDHLTPTAKEIEQVTRNYAAYIVECAKYQIETA